VPVMSGRHNAASFLVRKGLSRKAQLSLQIRRYIAKHPESILKSAVPFTIILETWDAHEEMNVSFGGVVANFGDSSYTTLGTSSLRERLGWVLEEAKQIFEESERSDWHWILKPSYTNKGSDIFVIEKWNDVIDALVSVEDIREWVLQKYIERPLLIQGHKFHIRTYVLCVGCLQVYVFEEMLTLLAAHKYTMDDISQFAAFSHLTNTARSCESIDFNEEQFVKALDDLPFYLPKSHARNFGNNNKVLKDIKNQIYNITGELFAAYKNEYSVFAPMENCFELLGLDFMVEYSSYYGVGSGSDSSHDATSGSDFDFKVSLLETNPGPDFKQTGNRLRGLIVRLWESTCQIVFDGVVSGSGDRNTDRDRNSSGMKLVYDERWSVSNESGGMKFQE